MQGVFENMGLHDVQIVWILRIVIVYSIVVLGGEVDGYTRSMLHGECQGEVMVLCAHGATDADGGARLQKRADVRRILRYCR